jgi:hypothetical protein
MLIAADELDELLRATRLDHAAGPERLRTRSALILKLADSYYHVWQDLKSAQEALDQMKGAHEALLAERNAMADELESLMYGRR